MVSSRAALCKTTASTTTSPTKCLLSIHNFQYVILIVVTTLLGGGSVYQTARHGGVEAVLMDSSAAISTADDTFRTSGGNDDAGSSGGGATASGSSNSNAGGGVSGEASNFYLDKIGIGNFEQSIAAVFNNVAYGTTTTKRSIPDNVFVPGLTTIATPALTTYRYRDRERDIMSEKHPPQSKPHQRTYEFDLERDHALPTSAPNANILKSNSNPTYPNPNRHHNHDRDRHRHPNSTPSPFYGGANQNKKGPPTIPMFSGDMPSYSPPARSFFTPPLPPEYQNPFADKPTLRGTISDTGVVNAGPFNSRRPIPPPSLMPGHERIPFRPPDLISSRSANPDESAAEQQQPQQAGAPGGGGGSSAVRQAVGSGGSGASTLNAAESQQLMESQRKKALNTPAQKSNKNGMDGMDAGNNTDAGSPGVFHFPSISRILSGSNGRKEDIPEILLRTVTARTSILPPPAPSVSSSRKHPAQAATTNLSNERDSSGLSNMGGDDMESTSEEEDMDTFDSFENQNSDPEEPKTQPKIKQQHGVSTEAPQYQNENEHVYSTQMIQNLANVNNDRNLYASTKPNDHQAKGNKADENGGGGNGGNDAFTWTVAWNIHVYLSAILFTVLAVYSIFKMIFYDKLTHLFNQSYFISIHLILIVICLARIFFLCYDAYNLHYSFHMYVAELLLNLPATFLTISFAILILFLLIRSLNHKNNRYSALMRPLTIVVGGSVHVGLCVTLHYVESYGSHSQMYYQNRQYNGGNSGGGGGIRNGYVNHAPPPRVLSLICQIIYIFVCLSLGLFYLYIYRILKRVLRNKSQNYIHGYQNLSYAIHITIASALLLILLAALQIYGAISLSTSRPLIINNSDIDWLQWGHQFSLRLIEFAIITLISWVTGLKTGASKMLQREKGIENQNVSGFALFPCTSSSSQEHFENDYPAICNANTNLHTYTLRTGKPIYDDSFALNSLGMEGAGGGVGVHPQQAQAAMQPPPLPIPRGSDIQLQNAEFPRPYDVNSTRSSSHSDRRIEQCITDGSEVGADYLNECNMGGINTDHYENPNFEFRTAAGDAQGAAQFIQGELQPDDCYSEPINEIRGAIDGNKMVGPPQSSGIPGQPPQQFDFHNFERPAFDRTVSRNEFRASKNLKVFKNNNLERTHMENPERRSSNSNHSYSSARNFNNLNFNHNSFDRCGGIRKSGTLNNIGGMHTAIGMSVVNKGGERGGVGGMVSGGGNSRPSGVQTLNTSRSQHDQYHLQRSIPNRTSNGKSQPGQAQRDQRHAQQQHRMSLERSSTCHLVQNPGGIGMMHDDYKQGGDNESCASSDSVRCAYPADARVYKTQQLQNGGGGPVNRQGSPLPSDIQQSSSSSGDSVTSGSMLVAEHGFVRFRALDDAIAPSVHNVSQQQLSGGAVVGSGGSGAGGIAAQQYPTQMSAASAQNLNNTGVKTRCSGRNREKRYTNS